MISTTGCRWLHRLFKIHRLFLVLKTWTPVSNNEPYARSSMDLMKLAKVTFDEFFVIPVGIQDHMVQYLADGLDMLFHDYIAFVSACGICLRLQFDLIMKFNVGN